MILKDKACPPNLVLSACHLAWGMAVYAATRAVLVESDAVTAISAMLVSMAPKLLSSLSQDSTYTPIITDMPGEKVSCVSGTYINLGHASVTVERELVECGLGALNIFMVDRKAREILLAKPKIYAALMPLLFEIAGAERRSRMWESVQSSKEQDASQAQSFQNEPLGLKHSSHSMPEGDQQHPCALHCHQANCPGRTSWHSGTEQTWSSLAEHESRKCARQKLHR